MEFFKRNSPDEGILLFRSQSVRRRFLFSKEFWVKAAGLLGSALFNILLLSEPPFVVSLIQSVPIPAPLVLGILVSIVFGLVTLVTLVIERKTRNRHFAVQSALRDFSVLTAESIRNIRNTDIERLCQDCCDAAASVFIAELPKVGIGCAIRLADAKKGGYVTIARSGRLSKTRKKSSVPVGFDATLASVLKSPEAQNSSVMICPDVQRAYDKDYLDRDENSKRDEYKDEVRCMMLARIIATDGYGEGELAGFFYITSDVVYGLGDKEVDLMVTVSTMVSEAIREALDIPSMSAEDVEGLITSISQDIYINKLEGAGGETVARSRKKGHRKR